MEMSNTLIGLLIAWPVGGVIWDALCMINGWYAKRQRSSPTGRLAAAICWPYLVSVCIIIMAFYRAADVGKWLRRTL